MTDDDRALLDFAAQRWNYAGNQADGIRAEFGISVTRFWQKVNRILDTEEALAHNPVAVNRLRRLRSRAR
ncbi:DUF3263 domain-containing protein [Gordonia rubripertincta]|uniref:Helix-turn-helix DNA binding domain protein n=1 Tax=Gordonia phage William TaxID=2571253 RepID=A0A4Y6EEJ8_9CAUD|nr:DUF3263 domain-containing protein [Gordonia rubripertincta]YP_010001259.1 DUF3263 domain-containing protein [Gordonia phage William]QDF17136.1 hypothetical protein SEA_WILLIAM_41 [Gordonia phage William]QMU19052.1 DUF3263 domain-containing protein [Gordonia rubripertincta]